MNQSNVAALPTAAEAPINQLSSFGSQGLLMDFEKVRAMQELANIMATAKVTVPAHLAGKAGDCLAVIMQAAQWGMNPFAVAQKTHVVNGTLGYEAQLVNAVVQASGAIQGRFHYEYQGDGSDVSCRVGAVIAGEKEITWGEWLKASSVTTKNSPLWKTNPKQQLGYLQVKNWARAHTPGAILGVYSTDEIEDRIERDMGSAEVIEGHASAPANSKTEALKSKLGAGKAATLDKVLAAIGEATTPEGMADAAKLAEKLNDADKATAAEAYKARIRELKARSATTEAAPATAEQQTGTAPTVTFEAVKAKLEGAKDQDELDAAADLIGEVPDLGRRDDLGHIYKQRAQAFKDAAQ